MAEIEIEIMYMIITRKAQTTEIQDCKQRAVELATNIEKLEISTLMYIEAHQLMVSLCILITFHRNKK